VDWSPTWDELKAEVDAKKPFVVLTSVTSSGHYMTVVGYHTDKRTVVVNDPYGNKNQGYMNWNGAGVLYDWPGYNNGYANLSTVWCFIYCRSTVPVGIRSATIEDPILICSGIFKGFSYKDTNTTRDSGGSDVFNRYSAAPTVRQDGREKVYRLSTLMSGTLTATVECDESVDVDIHLLSALSHASGTADKCVVRADKTFSTPVKAGTHYIVCDSYTTSGGIEKMGDYKLTVTFQPNWVTFDAGLEPVLHDGTFGAYY
jgi:hypothetical protein